MRKEPGSLAERLKWASHRICSLILNTDLDWIDIELQINEMRELCRAEAPEKAELFEVIYASRFERLWEQWRRTQAEDDPWPGDDDEDGRGKPRDLAC